MIVADGASTDGTSELLARRYPAVRLLTLRRNLGFAGNVNAGLRAARGEVLCLLNNDARADVDWVAACVEALANRPRAGSVASKVLYADGRTINSAGDLLCRDGAARQRGNGQPDAPEWDVPCDVFGASGGAAAYRRAMLADIGLLDEQFFMYLEDVDLAFRAQLRGWTCRYAPAARAVHLGGASGGGPLESFYNGRNLIRLLAKDLPSGLIPRLLPSIARFQARRAREALARMARRGRSGYPARSTRRPGAAAPPPGRSSRHPASPPRLGPRHLRAAEPGARVTPFLSLVIPAYNEQARLPYTLSEIETYVCREQIDCEVIVVDNGSHDATSVVVQQAASRFPRLRLLRTDRRGKGLAVRTGMLAARGQVVIFRRCRPVLVGRRPVALHDPGRPDTDADRDRLARGLRRAAHRRAGVPPRHGPRLQSRRPDAGGARYRRFAVWLQGLHARRRRARSSSASASTASASTSKSCIWPADSAIPIRVVPLRWEHKENSRVVPVRDTLLMLSDVLRVRLNGWRADVTPDDCRERVGRRAAGRRDQTVCE